MKGILLVDHGSIRREANDMLIAVADMIQRMAGDDIIVRYAHMELAEPTIAEGFANCVEAGATDIVVFPYMLSPGRHSTTDVPRMVAEAAAHHDGVAFSVTDAFGIDEKLGEIVLARAGIRATASRT